MTSATMAKATRKSVDFLDLIDRINTYKDTPEWKALSFGAKVRLLIQQALDNGGDTDD